MARLMANMYYVGGIAHLLGIEEDSIASAVEQQFRGKENAISMNLQAISEARSYASENWGDVSRYSAQSREKSDGTFLIEGNEATALGCIYGGINMLSWYPITPSSSLAESIIKWIPKLRQGEDGGSTCAVVQAEDELAAAGMVLGAGWAGGRGMTCTSGPGISLMSEFIGLFYFSEVPGSFGISTGLVPRLDCRQELNKGIWQCVTRPVTETHSILYSFPVLWMSASNSDGGPSIMQRGSKL